MKNIKFIPLIIGLCLLFLFILMAIFPWMFTPYSQKEMFLPWINPNSEHILGTNTLGYDIFTELVYGAFETLFVGLTSSLISCTLGVIIGILSSFKGFVGAIFNGIINIFILLPRLIALIAIGSFFSGSTFMIIVLISIFSWVAIARNVRSKVIHIYSQNFIENLKIQGFSQFHIIIFHVIPNLFDVLISRFLLNINTTIIMESTLSFLGFGDIYYPTWGTMINFAYKRGAFIRQAFAYLLSPGICIMLLSLSFYLISLYFENRKNSIKLR